MVARDTERACNAAKARERGQARLPVSHGVNQYTNIDGQLLQY